MKCVNHLEVDATGICNHCGKSICPECLVEIQGEMYCKACVPLKTGQIKKEERSPALAAVLSFTIPGLGQIYNGQVGKGILIFLTGWLIIPWIIGIFDAYNIAKKVQAGELSIKSKPGCLIAFVIGTVVAMFMFFFVALLAAIAIPNFLRARLIANESAAQAVIKTISSASETYAAANNGLYPTDESQLSSYLPTSYNNKVINGYNYSLRFRPDGYEITAEPEKCGVSGIRIFAVKGKGEIVVTECKEKGY